LGTIATQNFQWAPTGTPAASSGSRGLPRRFFFKKRVS
jgi:hypothetical protein